MKQMVKDLMRNGLITCLPGASLVQVATMLTERHVHALVVAEQNEDPLGSSPIST